MFACRHFLERDFDWAIPYCEVSGCRREWKEAGWRWEFRCSGASPMAIHWLLLFDYQLSFLLLNTPADEMVLASWRRLAL
jgi:hypothetical protein